MNFLQQASQIYEKYSTILALVALLGGIVAFINWIQKITLVLYRVGKGLTENRIVIFAKANHFNSLRQLLLDSKLFKEKNIIAITTESDITASPTAKLYLVYWPDYKNEIDAILKQKANNTALIVYAPPENELKSEEMIKLCAERNTIITNFRGRLLNDIVVSMITTGFEKK